MKVTGAPGAPHPAARELSRRQICYRLGCSVAQVQRWEAQGKLVGRRERPEGFSRVWFPIEQVQKIQKEWVPRRTRPEAQHLNMANTNARGKLAARAFRMFTQSRSLVDVVSELEIDPILAEQFWREYQLSFEQRDRLRREREQRERDRIDQRAKDRADSLQTFREHQKELAQIQAKATVEAAKEAAKIAARRIA